jgi:serine/threonine protein kinase
MQGGTLEQLGPYQLIRQLAVGGMAEVYLAKTTGVAGFEKHVALKLIHPTLAENRDFITMLIDEAKIAVQLSHPNIAQTLDLGRDGDTYYLAMELIDGIDLFNLIRASQHVGFLLPFDACAFIAREIANALEHAHGKRDGRGELLGVVHRDIAPDNVLLSYEGAVKLIDFGIAKATARGSQTAIGVIKGKYSYMSPEQATGEPVDAASDLYSTGVVLYEMLTGRRLYDEPNPYRLLELVREGSFAAPSRLRTEIPSALEHIVMRCLAPRARRYQDARELATDLHVFLQSYSPQFVTGTLASLIEVVVDRATGVADPGRAGDQRLPVAAVGTGGKRPVTHAGLGFPAAAPEPSWSSERTNPLHPRQLDPHALPRAPRAESLFDDRFDELFEHLQVIGTSRDTGAMDARPDFVLEDASKQIVIAIDKPDT